MANVGYARVSTTDQDPALQHDALAAAKCVKVFDDCASGARADRIGLQAALNYAREGDVLVVWKLDRLGRSLPHLIETVTTLAKRGVGFRSITEAIDTTTPGGRLVFHLFGALGQFERDLIQERTRAGLEAASTRGRKGGRKPVITGEKLESSAPLPLGQFADAARRHRPCRATCHQPSLRQIILKILWQLMFKMTALTRRLSAGFVATNRSHHQAYGLISD